MVNIHSVDICGYKQLQVESKDTHKYAAAHAEIVCPKSGNSLTLKW